MSSVPQALGGGGEKSLYLLTKQKLRVPYYTYLILKLTKTKILAMSPVLAQYFYLLYCFNGPIILKWTGAFLILHCHAAKWKTSGRLLHGMGVPLTHTLKSKDDTLVIHMLCPLPCRIHHSLHISFCCAVPGVSSHHSACPFKPHNPGQQLLLPPPGPGCTGIWCSWGTSVTGIMMSGSLGIILWGLPTLGLHFSDQMRIRLLIFQELFVIEQ